MIDYAYWNYTRTGGSAPVTSIGARATDFLFNRRSVSITVSCLIHPLAFLILETEYDPLPPIPSFSEGFTVAMLLLLGLSFVTSLSSDRRTVGGTLIARLILFLLLSRALGPSFQIERVLVASLILDSVLHEGTIVGSIASVLTVGLSIAVHAVINPHPDTGLVDYWRQVSVFAACGGVWLLVSLVISLALTRLANASVRLTRSEESVSSLIDLNVKYQQHVHDVSEKTRAEERRRITIDLHDSLSYTMTNIMMMIEAAKYLVRDRPAETEAHLSRIYRQAKEGLDSTRATLHNLYEVIPEPLNGLAAINRILKDFETVSGIEIRTDFADTPHLFTRDESVAIIRFVQEAIANAFRHGKATRIHVHFQRMGEGVSITVTDNGIGSTQVVPGLGLAGMMQRFEKLGGTLETADTQWGFEVRGWIPYGNRRLTGAMYGQNPDC